MNYLCVNFLTGLANMQNKKLILSLILVSLAFFLSCGNNTDEQELQHKAYQNPSVVNITDAIALKPEDASLYFKRSIALSHIQQDDLALKDLDKAIALEPQNDTYLIGKGELLYVLGRYSESVMVFKKAFELNPQKIQIQLSIAKSLLMDNKGVQAEQVVDKLLTQIPDYPDAYFVQAQIDTANANIPEAILNLKKALYIDPYYYEASLMMAEVLAASNQSKAVSVYKYTYSLDSSDVYPLSQIGFYYEQVKDTVRAKIAYNEAIGQDKDYTDAYIRLGKILVSQDSIEKAKRMFNIAVLTEPTNSQAHYLLGSMYERLNVKDSAKMFYSNALGLDPQNKIAKEAFEQIKK